MSKLDKEKAFKNITLDDIRTHAEFNTPVASREAQVQRLRKEQFDVLVIGGGATGVATALESATRGLRVGLIEADDFASGTSSRSTKLVHGGVRYLEQSVKRLDFQYCKLVLEALKERTTFLFMAPYLTNELRISTPVYESWFRAFYYYVGLKLYDMVAWVAGKLESQYQNLRPAKLISKKKLLSEMPHLKKEKLKCGIEYSDGQFDDVRMNVVTAMTAAFYGAAITNHVRGVALMKSEKKIVGVHAKDMLTGDAFEIKAHVVINATGPFSDTIRQIDDEKAVPIVMPSAGTHIVIENRSNLKKGILLPKAPNGSVAFILPFQNRLLIGTTDTKTTVSSTPRPVPQDVQYLTDVYNSVHEKDHEIDLSDVLSEWMGIRPLVLDLNKKDSTQLSRNHEILKSPSGLVTIAGGKWTTFRQMAQDVIDFVAKSYGLKIGASVTGMKQLLGSYGFSQHFVHRLKAESDLDEEIAQHLANTYGTFALKVADIAKSGYAAKLHPKYPYIEAEVIYSTQYEYARTPQDVLSRRLGLDFLDKKAAKECLNKVNELMAQVLNRSSKESQKKLEEAKRYYEAISLSDRSEETRAT